jgi:hypothetical protein
MHDQIAPTLLTRKPLLLKLNERGFPLTMSNLNKLCLPSVNGGPPVAKWWGKRPLYNLEDALAWAESLCSSKPGKLIAPQVEREKLPAKLIAPPVERAELSAHSELLQQDHSAERHEAKPRCSSKPGKLNRLPQSPK